MNSSSARERSRTETERKGANKGKEAFINADSTARVAMIDPELVQINKRVVHRQMEAMGMRAGLRAGTELQALGQTTEASREYMLKMRRDVRTALQERDEPFEDYRTKR